MDLFKSWIISAAVYLVINFALSVTLGYSLYWLYTLCPLLAGVAASAYHAERGLGGWVRHLIAVLPVPILLNTYWAFLQGIPSTSDQWGLVGVAAAQAGFITAVGLGLVMLTRWLMLRKAEQE